jgi:hypothetical protein
METTKKKCPQCGLVNFSIEMECRRCGGLLVSPIATHSVNEQKKSQLSSALLALLAFLLIAGGISYWSNKTNSNQPILYNPENIAKTKIAPVPQTSLENINPHDTGQIQKMIEPIDEIEPIEKRIEQMEEFKRKTHEDFKMRVRKPFTK